MACLVVSDPSVAQWGDILSELALICVDVRFQKVGMTTSVSNGTGQCNFSGQKFLHCPGTKGQRDKLKILPRDGGQAGTAKIRDGKGRDSKNPGRDAGQNGTEQKRTF